MAPLSLIFVLVTMALSPRGCDLCSHGILIVGELSTQMNISCADAKGSLEKVLFAFRKQSGRVLKLSISINKFLVFVSVILPRFVAVSVPEQAGSQCYCHQDGKYLKSWNLYQVEQLRLRYRIAPVNSCLFRCISTLNVANKMPKPYYEPGEGWTVPISLFSLREISMGLIRTSQISGSKSSSNFECADVNPSLNTYRHPGGWSALDRCLVPESLVNTAKLYPTVKTLTSHAAQGHEILNLMVQVRPNVLNHPADVIPSGVFMPEDGTPVHTRELQQLIRLLHREHGRLGGTIAVCSNCSCTTDGPPNVENMFAGCFSPSECQKCGLRNCGVNYFPACRTSYLTIASCFWSWWRMQPVPRQNPHIKPYCRARKYLRSDAQWINVPNEVATDLVRESRSAVIANLDLYQQVNECYALPRMRVQEMLEVIDRCIEGIPYVPLDEANAQARGLGNMVAFWERMRNICPKVNSYYGPVYGREGKQCVTSLDLDEAMLATRDFWFQAPTD